MDGISQLSRPSMSLPLSGLARNYIQATMTLSQAETHQCTCLHKSPDTKPTQMQVSSQTAANRLQPTRSLATAWQVRWHQPALCHAFHMQRCVHHCYHLVSWCTHRYLGTVLQGRPPAQDGCTQQHHATIPEWTPGSVIGETTKLEMSGNSATGRVERSFALLTRTIFLCVLPL